MTCRTLAVVAALAIATPAFADDDMIPGHTVDRPVNGAIVGGSFAIGLVSQLIPLRSTELWGTELASFDDQVRGTFSPRASHLSDGLLAASLAAPVFYLMGSTIDDADGDKLMVYGETIAINTLIAGVTKRLVQRPRPYVYSSDPAVRRYQRDQGDDAFLSFYSGHAALSFGAAVTGAYLLGASGENRTARALAWGGGLLVASATSNLRVRAGKHFYSDVLIGGLVGISVGYLVPALHADTQPYKPSGEELAAGAAGILGGMLLSQLLPLERKLTEDGKPHGPSAVLDRLQLSPMPVAGGFGFSIGGGM
jgi:membrane-associated phospholipid phosphatase